MVCILILEISILSIKNSSSNGYNNRYARLQAIKNLDKSLKSNELIKDYLHDDILQNLILIRRNITDKLDPDVNLELIENMIISIRHQMHDISPIILNGNSLKKSYLDIIEYTKNKYKDRVLLCELFCDDNIFIPYPYDMLTYKFIGELLNNIYKHTDSNFAEIGISYKDNILNIYSYNDIGNIPPNSLDTNKNTGLVYIKNMVISLCGSIEIENYQEGLKIELEIPIKEDDFIENFINR